MTTDQIIKESDLRLQDLTAGFDPITGEGSLVDRFPIQLTPESKKIFLPNSMKEEYSRLGDEPLSEIVGNGKDFDAEIARLSSIRVYHDFEFWSYTAAFILDKESSGIIPFKLNRAQRIVLARLEKMREDGKPMRLILLKARQWGGSTMIQIYIGWLQLCHYENWHSTIVSGQDDQASKIRSMYTTLLDKYPLGEYKFTPHERSSKNRIIKERGCIQCVASYESYEGIRSQDLRCIHLSELGTWHTTPSKSPEALIAAVSGAQLPMAGTISIYESTAQGEGNFFHRFWEKVESGENNSFEGEFVAWFDNPFDVIPFKNVEEKRGLVESLNEDEIKMLELGATLEGINWYRFRSDEIVSEGQSLMKQENPSTPMEAFQSTGSPVFAIDYINNLKPSIEEPKEIGEISADSMTGEETFSNIIFSPINKGNLSIWNRPNDPPIDHGYVMSGIRYVVPMDVGGTSNQSDYTSIGVIDRYWMAADPDYGKPEVVAHWHGHLDPDLVAWKAAQIAHWYNYGLLIPEVNVYQSRYQKHEGTHIFTVIDEIVDYYENIYLRQNQIDNPYPTKHSKYGFLTDKRTRPMIIDNYRKMLREQGYTEKNHKALKEARYFELKPDGKSGAADGQHDDILMERMIGLYVACSELEKPTLIKKVDTQPAVRGKFRKPTGAAAQF